MFSRVFLIFFLLFGTQSEAKRNAFLACVQEQLQALEIETGPIDGLLGPATKRGLGELIDKRPILASLPNLTPRTAVTWCREIAESDPRLRRFTPAAKRRDNIVVENKENENLRQMVINADSKARAFYERNYGIVPAAGYSILVGHTSAWLYNSLESLREKDGRLGRIKRSSLVNRCSNGRFSAFATRAVIVLCFDEAVFGPDVPLTSYYDIMYGVMVHEVAHHIQQELVGDVVEFYQKANAEPWMGPAWMLEGHATVMERRQKESINVYVDSLVTVWFKAKGAKSTLSQLRKGGRISSTEEYDVSTFAVLLLSKRFGDEAVWNYFEQIGRGFTWAEAFQNAFGLDLFNFEKVYQTELLRSSESAVAWTTANGVKK